MSTEVTEQHEASASERQLERIRSQERSVSEIKKDVDAIRATLKERKEEYDGAVAQLLSMIRDASDPQPRLFDPFADDKGASEGDETWKDVRVESLGLSQSIVDLLHNADIQTIGDIHAWGSEKRKSLTDIKGVGASKAEEIENALMSFWESRGRSGS